MLTAVKDDFSESMVGQVLQVGLSIPGDVCPGLSGCVQSFVAAAREVVFIRRVEVEVRAPAGMDDAVARI